MGCIVLCRTSHIAPEKGQGPTLIVPHFSCSSPGPYSSTEHSQCDFTIKSLALHCNSTDTDLFYFTVGYTKAYPQLVPKAPAVSLISLTPIMSIISQMVVIIAFQFFTWEFVRQQPW